MGLFEPERGQMFVEGMGMFFCPFWLRGRLRCHSSPAKTRICKSLLTCSLAEITLFDVTDRPPLKGRAGEGQLRSGNFNSRDIPSLPELQIPIICPSRLQTTTSGYLLILDTDGY